MSASIPIRRGQIAIQSTTIGGKDSCVGGVVHGSNDVSADLHVMSKAIEYRNAAPRLGLVIVLDMLPPWKAWLCRVVLRMEVGCLRTEKINGQPRLMSNEEWLRRRGEK